MGISRIGDLLKGNLQRHSWGRGVEAARAVDAANLALAEVFGKDVQAYLSAAAYERGEVRIAFSDSVAATEAKNRERDIIAKIQKLVPGIRVSRLRLVPATALPGE